MNPQHHPPEERLLEHAAGTLLAGRDLVVAAHVAVCEACRAKVGVCEAVGGSLLDAQAPVAMGEDALAHTLARVERPAPDTALAPAVTPASWIGFDSPAVAEGWRRRRWAAPGVWVGTVISGPGASRTYLLRVAAGMSVPRHTHDGVEMVTVLKGAYEDRETIHAPGDFAENDGSVDHRPTVTRGGDCVCLICTDAPLIARDWVGRLFQPLVRI